MALKFADFPLPCIVCGFQPEAEHGEGNNPYAATTFVTHGHYGSTIFDPMDGTFIEINVCDACLRRKAEEGAIGEGKDYERVGGQMKKIPYDKQPRLKEWKP